MSRSLQTTDELTAYTTRTESLTQRQLLAIVQTELPRNPRIRLRVDVLAARGDARFLTHLLRENLDDWLGESEYVREAGAADAIAPFELLLELVQDHLLPLDATAAMSIIEHLIQNDGALFERIDDSYSHVGHLFEQAVRVWRLCAQAALRLQGLIAERAATLSLNDPYGGFRFLQIHTIPD